MISFRKATIEDFSFLLRLRNDSATREYSRNTAKVSETEHRVWLLATLSNPERFLYVAQNADTLVGTVRFDTLKDGFEISWTVAPEARGKGFGKQMVLQFAREMLSGKRLLAEVKRGNIASEKIAQALGLSPGPAKDNIVTWR